LVADGGGEHRLANAGRADQQAVGLLLDEPQRRQLVDQPASEIGLCGEVELLDRLLGGQLGEPQPAGETLVVQRGDLAGEQVVQELAVGRLVMLGGLQGRGELFGGRGHPEGVQVLA
jgi:hypothetical protein